MNTSWFLPSVTGPQIWAHLSLVTGTRCNSVYPMQASLWPASTGPWVSGWVSKWGNKRLLTLVLALLKQSQQQARLGKETGRQAGWREPGYVSTVFSPRLKIAAEQSTGSWLRRECWEAVWRALLFCRKIKSLTFTQMAHNSTGFWTENMSLV